MTYIIPYMILYTYMYGLTQMSCSDGLQPNRLHCPGSQHKFMSTTIETLRVKYKITNVNLVF